MARQPIPLEQRGASAMYTTRGERRPAGTVHYAVNMFPASVKNPNSPWVTRGSFVNIGTGTAAGSAVVACGQLFTVNGTGVTWLLSSSSGLWAFDWSLGTYSNVVTAANFTTAGITLSAVTHYWCVFNNTICFNPSNGTQQPFTWDGGSGAGSLTELTNAPMAYGRPTTYNAKLFFIKYTERDTIVWSEEATANTGYEAGGYTNVWKLGQTGTAPLVAIQGTNECLYYLRASSIGAIRGAVNSEFVTTATHDAISTNVGTLSPSGVLATGGDLWFFDQYMTPRVCQNGGQPQCLFDEWDVDVLGSEPFGFDLVGFDRSIGVNLTAEVLQLPVLGRMPYETIWFHVPASVPTSGRAFWVVSKDTLSPLGWVVPYIGAAAKPVAFVVTESTSGLSAPAIVDASAGRIMVMSFVAEADRNASGTGQATTYRLIGAPLGVTAVGDMQFDRLSVFLGSQASASVDVRMLTSRRATSATISSAQTVTANTGATEVVQRYTVGTNQSGRWAAPMLSLTSSADTLSLQWDGWSLLAYPLSTSPTVP